MSKDIQLGKDQIENYQNGDVDRPYKSKENTLSKIEFFSNKINEAEEKVIKIFIEKNNELLKLREQIEQLKAENEMLLETLIDECRCKEAEGGCTLVGTIEFIEKLKNKSWEALNNE